MNDQNPTRRGSRIRIDVGFSKSLSSLDSLIGDVTVKRIHAQCIGIKKVRTKYKLREVMIPKRFGVNKTSTKSYKS